MTNYATGHQAEKVAAEYLQTKGYTIIELNWRHARAEIDIIAQKRPRFHRPGPLVFFEVKHRKTDHQGRGLDYITPKKIQQMQFAAQLYVLVKKCSDDYIIGGIELSGSDYHITQVLENITI
ncbi:YraN family protein [Candidatus Saccharibacteria bacterium]|nr:MAG: YraN family protein [Candidatus Saccharibacteria bacterium]